MDFLSESSRWLPKGQIMLKGLVSISLISFYYAAVCLGQSPTSSDRKAIDEAQIRAQIESLKAVESKLLSDQNKIQDELDSTRQEIKKLESQILEEQGRKIQENKVQTQEEIRANQDAKIDKEIGQETSKREEEIRLAEESNQKIRAEKQKADRKNAMIAKYGDQIASRILDGTVWLGMTDEMARDSWGEPSKINRTVTSNLVHEQWVYPSVYLYFENGILTNIGSERFEGEPGEGS